MREEEFDGLFYVLLPDNRVETLSLDELDEAFQADQIADTALVCRVGDTKWVTLGELASIADEPAPLAPVYVPPMTPPAAYVPAPVSRAPDSMAPVTSDFSLAAFDDDLDLEALALRPKRRALWVVSVLGTAGLAGAAAVMVAGGVAASAPATTRAAAMLTPAAMAATSPPPPAATTAETAAPATASTPTGDRFSDEMKRALLDADEKPAAKKNALTTKTSGKLRKAKPARVKSKRGKGKGNAYDPLNGSL